MKISSASLLFLFSLSLQATDWKSLKPEGYVSDFAHVVDPSSKTALENYSAAVQQATGAQLAFVTVTTLDGEPIEDVANDLFHAWGIGQKGQDNGVLLLLVTGDRRSRLEIGHGLEAILPDGLDGMVLVGMRPALRAGRYGEAMMSAAQTIGSIIAKDKGVSINVALPQRRTREHPVRSIPWPLIFGGLFLFWLFARGAGRGGGGGFLTGMLLGNLMSGSSRRDYGSGSWGGFGGSDSGGGGFGGFGGGDSGGGGASSDW